jgi:hypothetical protein
MRGGREIDGARAHAVDGVVQREVLPAVANGLEPAWDAAQAANDHRIVAGRVGVAAALEDRHEKGRQEVAFCEDRINRPAGECVLKAGNGHFRLPVRHDLGHIIVRSSKGLAISRFKPSRRSRTASVATAPTRWSSVNALLPVASLLLPQQLDHALGGGCARRILVHGHRGRKLRVGHRSVVGIDVDAGLHGAGELRHHAVGIEGCDQHRVGRALDGGVDLIDLGLGRVVGVKLR